MKPTLRNILKARDRGALAEYLRDHFGLTLTDAQLRSLVEQAARAGGPAHDAWSEGTWRTWLRAKATQPPPTPASPDLRPADASSGPEGLEAALMESSDVAFSTAEFAFCRVIGADRVRADYPEELWEQLFPAAEAIDAPLKEQFEARGGGELLGKAPFASWLYARLVLLGLPGVDEENDLGGYGVHFVVKAAGRLVGILSVDAESDGVDLCLEGRTPDAAQRIKDRFFDLLLKDIRGVARCKIEVRGAELGWTNSYGWNGDYFLGGGNVSG